jgi:hypothetical protein
MRTGIHVPLVVARRELTLFSIFLTGRVDDSVWDLV